MNSLQACGTYVITFSERLLGRGVFLIVYPSKLEDSILK